MARLNATDLEGVRAEFAKDISRVREPISVTKPELAAAVDGLDQYMNESQGLINAAIPLAARTGLTTPQKARLLLHVINKRYITGA